MNCWEEQEEKNNLPYKESKRTRKETEKIEFLTRPVLVTGTLLVLAFFLGLFLCSVSGLLAKGHPLSGVSKPGTNVASNQSLILDVACSFADQVDCILGARLLELFNTIAQFVQVV